MTGFRIRPDYRDRPGYRTRLSESSIIESHIYWEAFQRSVAGIIQRVVPYGDHGRLAGPRPPAAPVPVINTVLISGDGPRVV